MANVTEMRKRSWKLPVICLLAGLVVGAGAAALAGWVAMPGMMLTVRESRYDDVERTAEELKKAIETMGIKVPIERARKWEDVETGEYHSLENCARCQVQMKHGVFIVGVGDCRKCYEQNIALWLDNDTEINIRFPHE